MSGFDIWHKVATSLNDVVDSAIWDLRQTEEYKSMGSEIERAFAIAMVMTCRISGIPHELSKTPKEKCGYFLVPQYEVGPYRVDFVFGHSKSKFELRQSVVIECDGHDWHERTKEQAAHDKKRDRFLQQQFGGVIHFTGSEIYRDPGACTLDALNALLAVVARHK